MSKNNKLKNNKTTKYIIAAAVASIVILAIAFIVINKGDDEKLTTDKPSNEKTQLSESGDLVIPVADITSQAKFYEYNANGTKLEIIAIKAPDGTIRTAFNTCQVCYSSGRGYYVQQGDNLVCQNCGNRFKASQVQVTKGGCNPVPILAEDKKVDATSITITKDYIEKAKVIFQNWKS